MNLNYYFGFLCVCLLGRPTDAISCYECNGIKRVAECKEIVACNQDERCYQDKILGDEGYLYNLGCRRKQECRTKPLHSGSIHDSCKECCDEETCNRGLCWNERGCTDSREVYCATVNSLFHICDTIHKAKLTCRRFCGLCDVVDGGFSDWTDWTDCDVTCGNGALTRSRTCTNPAPENGGEDCIGNHFETQPCQHSACPVDGGLSEWTDWTNCDVTCGNGIETRSRTCTNPAPENGGEDCVGNNTDTKPCQRSACPVHGGWSRWSPWGSCSVSCGPGFQRRERSCTSPYPDQDGDHCYGESRDDRLCDPKACADGGWTSWFTWSSCSVSCGNGIKTRSRDCTNPEPSVYGKYCRGQPNEVTSCNNNRCPDAKSSFSVDSPHSIVNAHLIFSHAINNLGGDFNESTGIFTCSKPGVYVFTFSLVKKRAAARVDVVGCYLRKNSDTNIIRVFVDPTDDDTDKGSAYAGNMALVHLNTDDYVALDGCNEPDTHMESWTSFSGFLLYSDA